MRGFSLVELSIVLVIMGLLAGGILAGQSLIQASKLRSVTVSIAQYETGVQSFREQYSAWPGDFNRAQQYWGTGAACPTNTTGGTCNGDGNGIVSCSPDYTGCEMTFANQHLGLAGLYPGSYDPNWPAAATVPMNKYAPPLKVASMSLSVWYLGPYNTVYYDNYGNKNYLRAGQLGTTSYFSSYLTPTLPCRDAASIDSKADDGKPGTGKYITPRLWCVTDTAAASYNTALYDVSQAGVGNNTWLEIPLN